LRRFDRAARSFQSCLEIDPDHLEASYGQGVLLRRYGDADGARAVFADMLKRAPDHLKAQEQLSQLEREQ
jgi:tetratricopeptide (TPR) repeat protein